MSLNGLDEPAIQEAYQQASNEVGGWFLLHYVSRDSVDLLARGKGGVVEARSAIAKYDQTSPLYGLIFYRRRKFLIKYIPEGTSRLLQARTAVHFQDIVEKYSPYETLLEITTADGLNDTSLAASFPLHTAASPSISSSRLDEISEDAEDGPSPRRGSIPASTTSTIHSSQRPSSDRRSEANAGANAATPTSFQGSFARSAARMSSAITPRQSMISPSKMSASRRAAQPEIEERPTTAPSPMAKTSEPELNSPQPSTDAESTGRDPPSATSTANAQSLRDVTEQTQRPWTSQDASNTSERANDTYHLDASRISASTERTSAETSATDGRRIDDDPYDFSKYDFAPKIKLVPRPVVSDERNKRPTVASISSVPATYRPIARRPESNRPKSQMSPVSTNAQPLPVVSPLSIPPIPSIPEYTPRPVSRGSIRSMQSQKAPMTAERLRLMKAVELRKRQLRQSTARLAEVNSVVNASGVPSTPVIAEETVDHFAQTANAVSPVTEATQTPAKKADSAVELGKRHSDAMGPSPKKSRSERSDRGIDEDVRPEIDDNGTESEFTNFSPTSPTATQTPSAAALEGSVVTSPSERTTVGAGQNIVVTENGSMEGPHGERRPSQAQAVEQTSGSARDAPGLGIEAPNVKRNLVPRIIMPDTLRPVSVISAVTPTYDVDSDTTPTVSPISHSDTSPRSPRSQNRDVARRRQGIVQPLHVEQDNIDSDDELLNELQTATFGEAKPVTVPKSPMGSKLAARKPSGSSLHSVGSVKSVTISPKISSSAINRMNDYPLRQPPSQDLTPTITSTSDNTDTTPGKRNVSKGIFARIQTLNEASGRDSPGLLSSQPNSPRPLTPDAYPEELRPKDHQRLTKGVSVRSQTNSYQRQLGRQNTAPAVHTLSRSPPASNFGQRTPVPPESVTVTARIVRSHTSPGRDDASGKLHQSDLVMNYKRASPQPEPTVPEISTSQPADQPPNTLTQSAQSSHSSNRKSWARQAPSLSPSAEDFPSPPNRLASNAAGSRTSFMLWDDEPAAAQKEGSRTSRFFKRMSTLGASNKRRSVMHTSPSLDASRSSATLSVSTVETPPAIVVGDLNIQFPDTLLWKRRIVEIDSKGYVTFAIPLAMDIQKNSTKKYHLTDFEMPYTPDVDRQELPHSIMLDSLDGNTTLQAACEDSLSHRQVLQTLRSHWKAWHAVGR